MKIPNRKPHRERIFFNLRHSKERLLNSVESVKTSFWLIPTLAVLVAIILAFLSVELDRSNFDKMHEHGFWLFGGQPNAARSLLSAIAGSLITVISIAFSVTLVAIQQAAGQYSAKIGASRTLKSDRSRTAYRTHLGHFVGMISGRSTKGIEPV
jgi:uncharacterized membrane protein